MTQLNQANSARGRASSHRKRLQVLAEEIRLHAQKLIQPRQLTKGLIYERKRKCGNKNCKCTRGDLHISEVLSFSKNGKEQSIYLTPYSIDKIEKLKEYVNNYKRFRANRAQIVCCYKQLIEEINKLEKYLTVSPAKGGSHEKK